VKEFVVERDSNSSLCAASLILVALSNACAEPDPCVTTAEVDRPSFCVQPQHSEQYYIEQSMLYFNTMDTAEDRDLGPNYSEWVARWEWPPWLKLTAFGREHLVAGDLLLRRFPSTIPERDCRAFDTNPFGRCRVTFYYEAHGGLGCPIYEEFTFNEAGEMTFIEAWSDLDGKRPMDPEKDPWAEHGEIHRMSTKLPGLGNSDGAIDLDSPAMAAAENADPEVHDFVERALNYYDRWLAELEASGGDAMWATGCGWDDADLNP